MNLHGWFRSIVITAGLAVAGAAAAHEYTAGDLHIVHPHALPTAMAGLNGAGYVTIENKGKMADTLLGASSSIARSVEIHTMSMEGGVMRMRPLPQGVPVPAGGSADLGPGGTHLMLLGLNKALAAGDAVPLTLEFARAGKVKVELHVMAATTDGNDPHIDRH